MSEVKSVSNNEESVAYLLRVIRVLRQTSLDLTLEKMEAALTQASSVFKAVDEAEHRQVKLEADHKKRVTEMAEEKAQRLEENRQLADQARRARDEREELNRAISTLQETVNGLHQQLATARTGLATVQQEQTSLAASNKQLRERNAELEARATEREQTVARAEKRWKDLQNEILRDSPRASEKSGAPAL